jgi:hypothetical protein
MKAGGRRLPATLAVMRRMLLLACAAALVASVAVVALAADEQLSERRGAKVPGRAAPAPDSGPFAVAAIRAQGDANAERHRAARAAYEGARPASGSVRSRPGRARLIAGIAERLGVSRRAMWEAVAAVRRQISPRAFSDARDEAAEIMAFELDRPVAEIQRAVRAELRERLDERGHR